MKKITVTCPSCLKTGEIPFDERIIENNERGIASINVPELLVCPHSFVAYIDKNYTMRDSFIPDFMIELPQINMSGNNYLSNAEQVEDIDMYLLSINIKAEELVNIINCIFMKKEILFINDNEVIISQITHLIKVLFLNSFKYDFSSCNMITFRNNRKSYKNHIIIGINSALNQKKKEKFSKRTKIEGVIVQKFLSEPYSKLAITIFRNEIYKAFLMSKTIMEILQSYPSDNKISKKELVDLLSKKHETKIQFEYLEFLLNIVKNYFEFNLSKLSDYFFPSFGL